MKLDKIDTKGNKTSLEVLDKIFSSKVNERLVDLLLYKTNANYKGRKAKTKQKNEIRGSTSKIYAQKGTGGARHASRKAPIFVGGGIAHGPKGENNYKIRKVNKSEKRIGIISLISKKNKDKNLIIFDDFKEKINKTKIMNEILFKQNIKNALVVADKNSINNIKLSLQNIPNVKLTDVNHFSAFDVAKFKKIIFTETSVKDLEKKLK
ncbi:MAG: 50S ribosomal protein L4 [Candidatus Pelagibacter sp.]